MRDENGSAAFCGISDGALDFFLGRRVPIRLSGSRIVPIIKNSAEFQLQKISGRNKRTFEFFDKSNQQSYRVNVQRGFVLSIVFPTLNALTGFFVAALVY